MLFDLVIAGSDTTASTITAALFLLHETRHAPQRAAALAEVPQCPMPQCTMPNA